MGCTSSKQARRDRQRSPTPFDRCYSAPIPRHRNGKGDGFHVVSLTSSTLGSLKLDQADPGASSDEEMMKSTNDHGRDSIEKAKSWSEKIDSRFPRSRSKTRSTEEPEIINAWELMAGLEDTSPLRPALRPIRPTLAASTPGCRSFSFGTVRDSTRVPELPPKPKLIDGSSPTPPLWTQTPPENSIVSDFDPEIISTFRKALEELSPRHPFLLRSPEPEKVASWHYFEDSGNNRDIPTFTGIVKARITAFQERIDARKANSNANRAKVSPSQKSLPGGEGKVVLYFTSLRGVRKTYEDCWAVRVILQGYGVKVDERDVSMHGGFKEELNEILGAGYGGNRLPRVFADGAYLGGAEEVRQMHESGELGKALGACELQTVGKGGVGRRCEGCGDVRFVPCETCSGSCKVYVEEEDDEGEEDAGGFRRCPECNENGLVRCRLCC